MRLDELRFIACGPFTDCTLHLQPGLNLLYGPNEAGKSSALRALHALLFGFAKQTSDNFIHPYPQLRVGGVLVNSRGERLACVRRKGIKATLRDGNDDQPLDESQLQAMLGGVNEELFTTVFGIDHARLRAGGDDVVRGHGRIGELLFAAGGVTHLRDKQKSLETAADDLFKPTGSRPRINVALSQLKQANDELRHLERSPDEWAAHDNEFRRLSEVEQSLRQQLAGAEAARSRLERIHAALGLLAAWKAKRAELQTLAHLPTMSDDAEQRFRAIRERQLLANSAKQKAEKHIERLQSQLQLLQVPQDLLSHAARIDDLYKRLGNHEKDMVDRAGLLGQQHTAQDEATRCLQKLGWQIAVDKASEHRLAEAKKARVRALASRHGEVTHKSKEKSQSLKRLREQFTKLDQQLTEFPEQTSTAALKEILASGNMILDIEQRLQERLVERQGLRRTADEALARLPYWQGTLEAACLLRTPSTETIDHLDDLHKEIVLRLKDVRAQREAQQSESETVTQELLALELVDSVPTEDDLKSARELRDRGVRLAVELLGGSDSDPSEIEAFVHEVDAGSDLPTALEPSIRQADGVADRLRRESARVAHKSQLLARRKSLVARAEALASELNEVESLQDTWQTDWLRVWEPCAIDPATPSEMRAWLRKHQEIVAHAGELAAMIEAIAADEQRVGKYRQHLSTELTRHEATISDELPLDQLIQCGQRQLERAAETASKLQRLQSERDRTTSEIAQAEAELAAADEELENWRVQWAEALMPLQLAATAIPEEVEVVLENMDALFRNLDAADSFRNRIWGIDQTAEKFTQASNEVCAIVAPDLAKLSVNEQVETLNKRCSESKQLKQQADSLEERIAAEQQSLAEAVRELHENQIAEDVLLAEAACTDREHLPAAIEKSARKKALEASIDDLELQIAPLSAGRPLTELVVEAEREDADQLPNKLKELNLQIDTLREQRDEVIAAKEREATALKQFAGAAAAAEKADERQSLLARLEDDAREYAVTIVASRLLQRAIERYRERTQGPVLSRASDYFQQLTCGAFQGLRGDYDQNGDDVLVGMRPDGASLPVEAMSEGTRDQLYLALRLGTLDHWFQRHEPIPFVVDDVLLTFDDDRAMAALATLFELSKRTQVLLFTHHKHLVELAQRVHAGDDATKRIHEIRFLDDIASR